MTVSLPIATNFCEATIELFDGLNFYVDGNSKITRENGTYENPRPNAFSLPAASVPAQFHSTAPRACPGSTPTCRASCYVQGLAKHAPALYTRYEQNAEALAAILDDKSGRAFAWSALKLGMWIEDNAARGFRWHVSGDVLNARHADWIVSVCKIAPEVPFWIYTRTLGTVRILKEAANLAVNVSADVDNYADARAVALAHDARLCYLTATDATLPDLPDGSVIFPDYPLRSRPGPYAEAGAAWFASLSAEQRKQVCPTDQFGQSEAHRCGPCTKCF